MMLSVTLIQLSEQPHVLPLGLNVRARGYQCTATSFPFSSPTLELDQFHA